MYRHHEESIEKLKTYFRNEEGVIAIVLDGSIVKGNERLDSDVDAIIVVTEERYRALLRNLETAAVFEKSEVKVWECRN